MMTAKSIPRKFGAVQKAIAEHRGTVERYVAGLVFMVSKFFKAAGRA